MARVAIIGPGAIGGTLAAWLVHAGHHEVTLCARRPLKELRVDTPDETLITHPRVITSLEDASPADHVLVATKAYDTGPTAAWLERLVKSGTVVSILQNGVEHLERFAPHVDRDQILPVIVWLHAERLLPTHIRQRSAARLIVPEGALSRLFAGIFEGTRIEVSIAGDFKSVAWRKLCGNSPGVLNTLLRQPTGILRSEPIGALAREIVAECAAVGRAEGAVLPDDIHTTVVQALCGIPPDSVNSMHADLEAGRPLELDARNGVIVRLGRKHGIPTPSNQMAVTLMEAMLANTQTRTE